MAIAVAMKAEKIIYLTAAAGLLEDVNDPSSLVPRLTSAELRDRIAHDSVSAGLIPTLRACADAVEGGVGYAHIIDGRVAHPPHWTSVVQGKRGSVSVDIGRSSISKKT